MCCVGVELDRSTRRAPIWSAGCVSSSQTQDPVSGQWGRCQEVLWTRPGGDAASPHRCWNWLHRVSLSRRLPAGWSCGAKGICPASAGTNWVHGAMFFLYPQKVAFRVAAFTPAVKVGICCQRVDRGIHTQPIAIYTSGEVEDIRAPRDVCLLHVQQLQKPSLQCEWSNALCPLCGELITDVLFDSLLDGVQRYSGRVYSLELQLTVASYMDCLLVHLCSNLFYCRGQHWLGVTLDAGGRVAGAVPLSV